MSIAPVPNAMPPARLDEYEASLSAFKANVACRTRVLDRLKQLAGAILIGPGRLEAANAALTQARDAELEAEDRLAVARADLFAAEAGIAAAEAQTGRGATGPQNPPAAPRPH